MGGRVWGSSRRGRAGGCGSTGAGTAPIAAIQVRCGMWVRRRCTARCHQHRVQGMAHAAARCRGWRRPAARPGAPAPGATVGSGDHGVVLAHARSAAWCAARQWAACSSGRRRPARGRRCRRAAGPVPAPGWRPARSHPGRWPPGHAAGAAAAACTQSRQAGSCGGHAGRPGVGDRSCIQATTWRPLGRRRLACRRFGRQHRRLRKRAAAPAPAAPCGGRAAPQPCSSSISCSGAALRRQPLQCVDGGDVMRPDCGAGRRRRSAEIAAARGQALQQRGMVDQRRATRCITSPSRCHWP
jgi:hypothetical protein